MSVDSFARDPSVYTHIGTISPDYVGRRVRIMGFIVDHQDQSGFILSDDTGQILVITDKLPPLQSFVRVFGSIAVSGDGNPLLRAEIIQDLAALDKQLFKRVLKIVHPSPSGRIT